MLDAAGRARLEAAYREAGSSLWRAIFAYSGGLADIADEAVAEAFAQAGQRLDLIRDIKAWVHSAAFHIANELLRQRREAISLDQITEPLAPAGSSQADFDLATELAAISHLLSPKQRMAFIMRGVLGYRTSETARLLDMSEVAVRVHLHAARRRLRRVLHGSHDE